MKKLYIGLILLLFTLPAFAAWVPGDAPFINTYLLLGTFDNSDFKSDLIGEETIAPFEGMKTNGKVWEYFDDRYFSRNYDDYADLFSYYRYEKQEDVTKKLAYLHVYLYSNKDQTAQLRGDGDSNLKVFFNGSKVIEDLPVQDTYKDQNIANINIKKGYNSILVKVGNEGLAYLGLYLRVCDENGNKIDGIRYCLNKSEKLEIVTKNLKAAGKHSLPFGYREWPYVEYRVPLYDKIDYSVVNTNIEQLRIAPSASYFYFTADGKGDLDWSFKGKLPQGITFDRDGKLVGRIDSRAKLGNYNFTVFVKDQIGNKAQKSFVLTVKERPNKWVENGRLTALIHMPEFMTNNDLVEEMARLMKRQNYTLAMPIAYGNGDYYFRWNSVFDKDCKYKDVMPQYKKALEKAGVPFGMYIGNFSGVPQFTYEQGMLVLEDAMKQLNPKAFWFDWAGIDRPQNDALFSALKSYNPDIVLILNGMLGAFYDGDYDIMAQEGMGYGNPELLWSLWPTEFRYNVTPFLVDSPKIGSVEGWRMMSNPEKIEKSLSGSDTHGKYQDWKDMMKIEISLIGDGIIANIDHSSYIYDNNNVKSLYDSYVMEVHKKMADWANPEGLTPLYTSYTQVMPYKMDNTAWGYSLINIDKNKIYLHFVENRRGKTGLPKENIAIGPINGKIKDIVWMNKGKKINFIQKNNKVTIDLTGVTPDEVDTIFCINMKNKLDYYPTYAPYPMESFTPKKETKVRMTSVTEGKSGDIAYNKPSKLLNVKGDKELFGSVFVRAAQNGNDNDLSTNAAASWFWDWTYWLDLEKEVNVKRLVLDFGENGFATEFLIRVSSDNINWRTIKDIKNNEAIHFEYDLNENFRYIKVTSIKPNGSNQKGGQMSIVGLELYE